MFRTRAASATLIVLGTLAVVITGGWVFFLGVLAVALAALDELMVMLAKAGYQPTRLLGHLLVMLFFTLALLGPGNNWFGNVVVVAIVGPMLLVMLRRNLAGTLADWAVSVATILYIGVLAAHAILLQTLGAPVTLGGLLWTNLPPLFQGSGLLIGTRWVLTGILVTWAVDTSAYAAGRTWGRHRIVPLISPAKTREGALGGLAAGVAAMVACVILLQLPLSLPVALLAGFVLSALAQLGDLAESLLKRQTGVKDSGQAIPGHGGVLDRLDSLLFTLPATYYLAVFTLP